jgi:hypothetical protein
MKLTLVHHLTKQYCFGYYGGVQKLTGENLKVVFAEFSTLSLVVLFMSITVRY